METIKIIYPGKLILYDSVTIIGAYPVEYHLGIIALLRSIIPY